MTMPNDTTPKLSEAQKQALVALPVEWGSYGAPHPNVLKALTSRKLAWLDYGCDAADGTPPDVRCTPTGKRIVQQLRGEGYRP